MMLSMRGAGLPVVMMADADMHADVFIKLTTVLFVCACLVPKPRLLSVILAYVVLAGSLFYCSSQSLQRCARHLRA